MTLLLTGTLLTFVNFQGNVSPRSFALVMVHVWNFRHPEAEAGGLLIQLGRKESKPLSGHHVHMLKGLQSYASHRHHANNDNNKNQEQQLPSKEGQPFEALIQRGIVLWSLNEFGLLWLGLSNSTGIHTENKQRCPDCHRHSLLGRQSAAVPRLFCQHLSGVQPGWGIATCVASQVALQSPSPTQVLLGTQRTLGHGMALTVSVREALVHHKTSFPRCIPAHFLICFISVFIARIVMRILGLSMTEPDGESSSMLLERPYTGLAWLQPPDQLPVQWKMERNTHGFFFSFFGKSCGR